MDIHSAINQLKQQGFVNLGKVPALSHVADELAQLISDVRAELPPNHPHSLAAEEYGGGGLRGVPQHHPRIARLLDDIVSNADVRRVLVSVLGADYKIWQIDFRRSVPGDKGLFVHQDAPGQVNICLLLSDNPRGEGATVFLRGSHLVPPRMKDLQISIPPYLLMSLRRLFTPMAGYAGDIGFFFNRAWHGRFANASSEYSDVVLLGFFPAGGRMGFAPPYMKWSPEFLESIKGTELGRLLDSDVGTECESNGMYRVLSSEQKASAEVSYALAIEDNGERQHGAPDARLGIVVAGLRAMTKAMRWVRPLAHAGRRWLGR